MSARNVSNNHSCIEEKVKQLDELKKILATETKENDKLKKENEDIKKENEKLKKENEKLKKENEKINKEKEDLKTKFDLKNNEYNNLIKLKDKNVELEKKIKELDNINEKIKLDKDPLEFYDIIININSMQNLNKEGWDIL